MKLASLKAGRDGQLPVVRADLDRAIAAYGIARTCRKPSIIGRA
ncbi:MAG: hypothetical protein QGG19_04515 [Alphaproteobacteria bacterium]|nr:hypothetical protein [Alphaproteobacteria bacterium]MDP6255199.1 hypothetical protein [Alphaproteobacteria bacterium]MDP7052619.1 hypothetical protein [Alphaproteobacteria bacterium]MDP7229736.1 hypothetical protein [Alphaproteobacteria bacterium]MDP7461610.1 hypothetical protein [Alphaproteobacteria bacterium]